MLHELGASVMYKKKTLFPSPEEQEFQNYMILHLAIHVSILTTLNTTIQNTLETCTGRDL